MVRVTKTFKKITLNDLQSFYATRLKCYVSLKNELILLLKGKEKGTNIRRWRRKSDFLREKGKRTLKVDTNEKTICLNRKMPPGQHPISKNHPLLIFRFIQTFYFCVLLLRFSFYRSRKQTSVKKKCCFKRFCCRGQQFCGKHWRRFVFKSKQYTSRLSFEKTFWNVHEPKSFSAKTFSGKVWPKVK